MDNQTVVSYFLLLEFSKSRHLQILYFFMFFLLYLATLTTNLLIISAVASDHRLHRPMYFFLMNLALQDLGSVSVIVPKCMMNFLLNTRYISYLGCVAQAFFFISFAASDFFLLTAMAYDRYVAICNPLQYETLISLKSCTEIVGLVWIVSFLYGTLHTTGIFSSSLCSNTVNQFFCNIPQLLKLSCSRINLIEVRIILVSAIVALACFTFIIISYAMIFKAVQRIPSEQGKLKALSTCIPHITVVSIFILTGFFVNMRRPSDTPSDLDLALTILYSLLPPLFNPIIYSMRNKNIKAVFFKLWRF
ncbi:olfactory receptor 14A2-like [Thamnophis elegans]|uniref:olfactory receptor 14A2-like n=1 Tax=Thamnophis elegans TaxID=35005 RepID=UPI0013780F68|nr:olfactory receptor 14A2-like [Thamnophis elegans]